MSSADVIIVGAGVAGLSCAAELDRHGVSTLLLEASGRVGGRVFTVHDRGIPIELGAEFVHGKPEILSSLIRVNRLSLEELEGRELRSHHGKLQSGGDFFPKVMGLLDRLRTDGPDRSFTEALREDAADEDEETKRSALEYVSGFHAADPERISEHALALSTKTGEQEHSDEAFRLLGGYEKVVNVLRRQLTTSALHLDCSVERVHWQRGKVEALSGTGEVFTAKQIVITIPLPRWDSLVIHPDLPRQREALRQLAMGPVLRVSLRFDRPWWEELQNGIAQDLSFLFSHHPDFPTWWRGTSDQPHLMTAWCAAQRAERLSRLDDAAICDHAVRALADVFSQPPETVRRHLQGAWTHNWQRDPHYLGGYSYVLKGGEPAPAILGEPVENTLFFAGEATDTRGDNGTVHGAMASGLRAALEVLSQH